MKKKKIEFSTYLFKEDIMRKAVVVLFVLLLSVSLFGDFTWMQLNLYQGLGVANSFGDTYDLTYFEVEGGGRTGCLNFYYFVDVNDIFGIRDQDVRDTVQPGDFLVM